MSDVVPTLFLICGKIAAGKSTLARDLADSRKALLMCEDAWLAKLYPGEIATLDDYVRCAARLRDAIGPHVISILESGQSVVMDFPANTIKQRQWLRGLFEAAAVTHELHVLDVPDAVCKQRLRDRNREGDHPFQTSDADFDLVTSYFVPPTPDEGFNIILHPFG